jgi:hypothetical protein
MQSSSETGFVARRILDLQPLDAADKGNLPLSSVFMLLHNNDLGCFFSADKIFFLAPKPILDVQPPSPGNAAWSVGPATLW